MSPTDPTYPWEQLTLLQPDYFRLKMTANLLGDTDRISVTLELRESLDQALVGMQTFGGDLSTDSVSEIVGEIGRWLHGAASRLVPFR